MPDREVEELYASVIEGDAEPELAGAWRDQPPGHTAEPDVQVDGEAEASRLLEPPSLWPRHRSEFDMIAVLTSLGFGRDKLNVIPVQAAKHYFLACNCLEGLTHEDAPVHQTPTNGPVFK